METTVKKRNVHARFYGTISRMSNANKKEIVWQYSHLLTTSLTEFLERNPQGYWAMVVDLEKKVQSQTWQQRAVADMIIERDIKAKRSAIELI